MVYRFLGADSGSGKNGPLLQLQRVLFFCSRFPFLSPPKAIRQLTDSTTDPIARNRNLLLLQADDEDSEDLRGDAHDFQGGVGEKWWWSLQPSGFRPLQ